MIQISGFRFSSSLTQICCMDLILLSFYKLEIFALIFKNYQKLASLPLLSPLLAGFGRGAGRWGRTPPLLASRVGLALLAIGCTGRLIRQTPCGAGSEGWRMRKSSRMRGWNGCTHKEGKRWKDKTGRGEGCRGGGGDDQGSCILPSLRIAFTQFLISFVHCDERLISYTLSLADKSPSNFCTVCLSKFTSYSTWFFTNLF